MSTPIKIRDALEIQKAHDMIVAIILDDVPEEMHATEEQKQALAKMASVLCWVLHHDHNVAFVDLMMQIEQIANDMGVVIERKKEA